MSDATADVIEAAMRALGIDEREGCSEWQIFLIVGLLEAAKQDLLAAVEPNLQDEGMVCEIQNEGGLLS